MSRFLFPQIVLSHRKYDKIPYLQKEVYLKRYLVFLIFCLVLIENVESLKRYYNTLGLTFNHFINYQTIDRPVIEIKYD